MGADELYNWLAYEMTTDSEYKDKVMHEIHLEESSLMTDEQRAEAIKKMFQDIGAS